MGNSQLYGILFILRITLKMIYFYLFANMFVYDYKTTGVQCYYVT